MTQIVISFVFIFFSALAGYGYGHQHGSDAIQAKWDKEKANKVTAQRTKEAELQSNMDQLRKEKNRETAKLRSTVAALTLSLRDRPERPAVPANPLLQLLFPGGAGGGIGPDLMAFRGPDAQKWQERLSAKGIVIDHRADVLRIGFGLYQDFEDVKRLVKACR